MSPATLKCMQIKHHLYGIALQHRFMLCATDTMGELGENRVSISLKSFLFRMARAKVVATEAIPQKLKTHCFEAKTDTNQKYHICHNFLTYLF